MTTYRIGRGPRLSRRQLAKRIVHRGLRYIAAYALVGWACMWIVDVHLLVPGIAIAAMVANPWRPKTRTLPSQVNTARTAPRMRVPWQSRATHSPPRLAAPVGLSSAQAPVRA